MQWFREPSTLVSLERRRIFGTLPSESRRDFKGGHQCASSSGFSQLKAGPMQIYAPRLAIEQRHLGFRQVLAETGYSSAIRPELCRYCRNFFPFTGKRDKINAISQPAEFLPAFSSQ
jgi:hypothetical protein